MKLKNTTENIVKDLTGIVERYHRVCCENKKEVDYETDLTRETKDFWLRTYGTMGRALLGDLLQYCDIFSLGYYFDVRGSKLVLRIYWDE